MKQVNLLAPLLRLTMIFMEKLHSVSMGCSAREVAIAAGVTCCTACGVEGGL